MREVVAFTAAAFAAVVLSACGSTQITPVSARLPNVHGPGSIVFVAGARSAGFGTKNSELVATSPSGGVRDLTKTAASENYPAWSADGLHVVYGRQSTGAPSSPGGSSPAGLYVWSPGHGAPHRIPVCAHCWESSFAWSPDDRHIAFVANGANTSGENSIRVMNADGSGVHTVCNATRCGQSLEGPTWSPDGRRLLFSNEGVLGFRGFVTPPSAIWVAKPDGSGVEKLTQPKCNEVAGKQRPGCAIDTAPAWSPNGRLIAFSRMNIDFVPTKGACGFARPVIGPPPAGPQGPVGSAPQTVKIQRCATVKPANGIEIMRADGSQLHRIGKSRHCTDRCGPNPPFAWSPDGETIAYSTLEVHHPSPIRFTTLAGKTTTIRACVRLRCLSAYGLTWSPSGDQLAFIAAYRPVTSVWVINRDGGGLHRVAPGGQYGLQWVRNSSLSH